MRMKGDPHDTYSRQKMAPGDATALPRLFDDWFAGQGWQLRAHQAEMLDLARAGRHALLIAPTGGGKTLAGFLPSLVELYQNPRPVEGGTGLHTLYISPLKALAVDVRRNLERPIAEMRLAIAAEARTGDTPPARRQRQTKRPPHILMTTPESLSLMLGSAEASHIFKGLRCIIVDELHALAGTKRGDLLSLCMARLSRLAPDARRVGLSATVAWPDSLRAWLSPAADGTLKDVALVSGDPGAPPQVEMHVTTARMPWSGHNALHAVPEVYERLRAAKMAIVFVNTRAFGEMVFQALWRINEDNLPIGLHHGSLAREQRRKVEAAMADGRLRAVVATSSLDLGIDWGDVDLVIQMGAPRGVSRLVQRIGRANHRLDDPSRAVVVPANRFEVMESLGALSSLAAGVLDGDRPGPGRLDVLAQHITASACAGGFFPDTLYAEVTSAAPYAMLTREQFDRVVDFVATGGYALKSYERFARLRRDDDGRYVPAGKHVVRAWRMNVGTIVEAETLKVRLNNGPVLGDIEEYFANGLTPGDSFMFAGRLLEFTGIRDMTVMARPGRGDEPKVPAYAGGRLPLTTHLADQVRSLLADSAKWVHLPPQVREWLEMQAARSALPGETGLLVESFPRKTRGQTRHYLVAYCFEGRNAHQTLGMLLTRRMERLGLRPLGFVASDYVICCWCLDALSTKHVKQLFEQDILGDELEEWMAESSLLKRTFRHVAIISGLIEKRHPGLEKTGRQVTFSTDLIYDVLRKHEPDHILMQATRADAAKGLTDIRRLSDMLARAQLGGIEHRRLKKPSPLALPVMLEAGREQVYGAADDDLMREAAEALVAEVMGEKTDRQAGG